MNGQDVAEETLDGVRDLCRSVDMLREVNIVEGKINKKEGTEGDVV